MRSKLLNGLEIIYDKAFDKEKEMLEKNEKIIFKRKFLFINASF